MWDQDPPIVSKHLFAWLICIILFLSWWCKEEFNEWGGTLRVKWGDPAGLEPSEGKTRARSWDAICRKEFGIFERKWKSFGTQGIKHGPGLRVFFFLLQGMNAVCSQHEQQWPGAQSSAELCRGQGPGGSSGVLEHKDTLPFPSEQCQSPRVLNAPLGHCKVLHGLSTQKHTEALASSLAPCARQG